MGSGVKMFIRQQLTCFAKDERGVSALEFAMVLPLMVTLYLGGVAVSQGISIDRKVTLAARTVADLTSQVSSVTTADLTEILKASGAILAPYPVSKAKVSVASIKIDGNSKVTMEWSKSEPVGSVAMPTVPTALIVPNTWLIWGETTYSYTPAIGEKLTGTLNLKDQIFMRPRLSEKVTCSGC